MPSERAHNLFRDLGFLLHDLENLGWILATCVYGDELTFVHGDRHHGVREVRVTPHGVRDDVG